jgi:hypothetical protein
MDVPFTLIFKSQHSDNLVNNRLKFKCNDNNIHTKYLELTDVFLSYFNFHDLLKLSLVSKQLSYIISNITYDKPCDYKEIINCAEHGCYKCIRHVLAYNRQYIPEILMTICKFGHVKSLYNIKTYFTYLTNLSINNIIYPPIDVNLADTNGNLIKCIHKCVMYAQTHELKIQLSLLQCITGCFKIDHCDTLNLICKNVDATIINNIVDKLGLSSGTFISESCVKAIFPHFCKYDMNIYVFHNINKFGNQDYEFLINLLKENINVYSRRVIEIIFKKITHEYKINKIDVDFLMSIIRDFDNKNILESFLLSRNFNNNQKLSFVSETYKHNLSNLVPFLDFTRKLNILSIQEANKNDNGLVYTDKLSIKDLLSFIISSDKKKVKENLIRKLGKEKYLIPSCYDNLVLKIISWAMHSDNIFMELVFSYKCIDIKFRKLLVPYLYKKQIFMYMDELMYTKELNILSITCALQNNNGPIYANKLTTEEILKFYINISDFNTNRMSNWKTKEMLLSYIDLDDVANLDKDIKVPVDKYLDNEVDERIMNIEYTKSLLDKGDIYYHPIFNKAMKLSNFPSNNHAFRNYKNDLQEVFAILVMHKKFNEVLPSTVIKLLKLAEFELSRNKIVSNHKYFEKFKNSI